MKKILVFEEVVKFYHTITVEGDTDKNIQQAIDSTDKDMGIDMAYKTLDKYINPIEVNEDYYGTTKSFECVKAIDIDE